MGGPKYSSMSRSVRSRELGYDSKPREQIFQSRNMPTSMDPKNALLRESRDSVDSPESLAIIIGLDVTGSMGNIPHHLVKHGLPDLVTKVIQNGIANPQILFLGIGDHTCDEAPLQVGQFESNDELLDNWLTSVWLEGGGGRNEGESYLLAHYYAAMHTKTDCWSKRNKKGFLFTIGDEPCLPSIPGDSIKKIMGLSQTENEFKAGQLVIAAMNEWHVFHIHIEETGAGHTFKYHPVWRTLLRDNLLMAESHTKVPSIIANKIIEVHLRECNYTQIPEADIYAAIEGEPAGASTSVETSALDGKDEEIL